MTETHIISTEAELEPVAKRVVELVAEQPPEAAAVLALHGDLGAGKTTFMQVLARTLGVTDTVVSPTFVVMKRYQTEHQRFTQLAHLDAYRIEDVDEMRPLRFDELLQEKEVMIAIEWAKRIESLLPTTTLHLDMAIVGETRTITLRYA